MDNLKAMHSEMQKNCGLKVGDKVRILRRAASYELGWSGRWAPEMDDCVGWDGVIKNDAIEHLGPEYNGFEVQVGTTRTWTFPWFVLEKIGSTPPSSLEDKIREIDFGCNTEKVIALLSWFVETYVEGKEDKS